MQPFVIVTVANGQRDSLVGSVFGGYRLEKLLGGGPTARVYEATHDRLGRRAAIKVLDPTQIANDDVSSRFYCEARAVAEVGAPHLVDVHDFIFEPKKGRVGYVMEYLEGDTLRRLLGRGRAIAPGRAANIGAQLCEALTAVHAHGVVHRDLRPENIMLLHRRGEADFAKLIDFGVAQFEGAVRHSTEAGFVIGTPAYMAPEQARGRRVDARADLYSLGVVLFEMLTGRLPYPGASAAETIESSLRHSIPTCDGNFGSGRVPKSLAKVVRRCLAKSADARYPSAEALRAALVDAAQLDGERSEDATAHIAGKAALLTQRIRRATERALPGGSLPIAFAGGVGLGLLIAAIF